MTKENPEKDQDINKDHIFHEQTVHTDNYT